MSLADILILSNGPGEVTTWVRPVVNQLRHHIPHARISLVLSPCSHASGKEAEIARQYIDLDRVQEAKYFWPFLLFGRTKERWNWAPFGVVLFLGGDQFFAVRLAKRLGYRVVVYAEWEARWKRWVDAFAIRTEDIAAKCSPRWHTKMYVVGDLMADAIDSAVRSRTVKFPTDPSPVDTIPSSEVQTDLEPIKPETAIGTSSELIPSLPWQWEHVDSPDRASFQIGLLPGSKPAKLSLGLPLMLAVADRLREMLPSVRFAIPVAPTLDIESLSSYAKVSQNWDISTIYGTSAVIEQGGSAMQLATPFGTTVTLWREFPSYDLLANCDLCLTTVGANTAELGRLGVPMVVLLPTNKLDAMRAWGGILGVLVRIPGVGRLFARVVNWFAIRLIPFLAWPNIWAQETVVPELRGHLTPQAVANEVRDILLDRHRYSQMYDRLAEWRVEPGAANKISQIVGVQLSRSGDPSLERSNDLVGKGGSPSDRL